MDKKEQGIAMFLIVLSLTAVLLGGAILLVKDNFLPFGSSPSPSGSSFLNTIQDEEDVEFDNFNDDDAEE